VKLLFILKQEPDSTIRTIMKENSGTAEIATVELANLQDYDLIIELIEASDRVITW
jgi:hypothetical protein